MKVLVVGASGFIGRHILAEAREAGLEALGTQFTAQAPDLIPFDLSCDRLRDATIAPFLESNGQGCVVVAAAFSQIDRCLRERDLSYRINVEATIQLIRDSVSLGLRPVFLSSSFVFDGRRGDYTDRDDRAPISEYGRQKAEVETFIEREVPAALVLRLDKTVGDHPVEKHLFSEWWAAARDGRAIRCIENQLFSPTLVDDVARGVVRACESGLTGCYNLSSPERWLRTDLAQHFLSVAGLSARVSPVSQRDLGFADLRPERSSLDSRALTRLMALRFTTMDEALRSFFVNLKQSPALR